LGRGWPHRVGATTWRRVRITRRYSVPPFKGVIAVKACEEIVAEIRIEAFVIEVGIAIAAALHSLKRPRRNLRSRAVVIDPGIAA